MTSTPSATMLVLDDGGPVGADMCERALALLPGAVVAVGGVGAPGRPGVPTVARVPAAGLGVRAAVDEAGRRGLFWVAVPRDIADPLEVIVDAASRAVRFLDEEQPGMAILCTQHGRRYRRAAVVADVKDPITTGLLAWAAVGLAERAGAALDVLVLGAEAQTWPADDAGALAQFQIDPDMTLLDEAVKRAERAGVVVRWVPLGYRSDRAAAVLEAVEAGSYDVVADDLSPIDVGPLLGRKKRVRSLLTASGRQDTAYALLCHADCDVVVILDAVRMGLVPPEAMKVAAASAVLFGVAGAAVIRPDDAPGSTEVVAASAESEVPGDPQTQLTQAQQDLQRVQQKQKQTAASIKESKTEYKASKEATANPAGTVVVTPSPDAESGNFLSNMLTGTQSVPVSDAVSEVSHDVVTKSPEQIQQEITAEKQRLQELQKQEKKIQRQINHLSRTVEGRVIPTTNYDITATFNQPGGSWSSGRHTGLDFAAPGGTPVYAAGDGTVTKAGWEGAYGNSVTIKHENGTRTTYSHLNSIEVQPGDKVEAGQLIGTVGSTGNSTGPHLHFEVINKNGEFVDPAQWLLL